MMMCAAEDDNDDGKGMDPSLKHRVFELFFIFFVGLKFHNGARTRVRNAIFFLLLHGTPRSAGAKQEKECKQADQNTTFHVCSVNVALPFRKGTTRKGMGLTMPSHALMHLSVCRFVHITINTQQI